MSPQPFPNIFSGLVQGVETGMKVGLMSKELEFKKEEMVQKQKRFDLNTELKLVNIDLDRARAVYERSKDLPFSEERSEMWNNVPMATDIGKAQVNFYQTADAATTKKVIELQTEIRDAVARNNLKELDVLWPEYIARVGSDSALGKASSEQFKMMRAAKAESLVSEEQTLREGIKSGKIQGKEKGAAWDRLKEVHAEIASFPDAEILFGQTQRKEWESSPDYMKHPQEAEAWERRKVGIRGPKDEFTRHINRLSQLEEEGKTNTSEYKRLADRATKMSEGTGLSISYTPDGGLQITQGAVGGLGAALTGQQALKEQAQLDRFNTILDVLDTTITNIKESPTRAGIWGSLRGAAQKVVGITSDVAPGVLAENIRNSIEQIGGLTGEQKKNLSGFFDPKIPENEIYENTLALELAKLRIQSGGSSIRALESSFKAAKKDVAITGLFSSQEALARLNIIQKEFETEKNKLEKRLGGTKQTSGTTSGGNRFTIKEMP